MTQPEQQRMPGPVVHCFFTGTCDHAVWDPDPHAAHDRMEEHYAEAHAEQIRALVGPTAPR